MLKRLTVCNHFVKVLNGWLTLSQRNSKTRNDPKKMLTRNFQDDILFSSSNFAMLSIF